jgi:hypothetical protein
MNGIHAVALPLLLRVIVTGTCSPLLQLALDVLRLRTKDGSCVCARKINRQLRANIVVVEIIATRNFCILDNISILAVHKSTQ